LKSSSFHVVLIAVLALSLPARACINESGTNRYGQIVDPVSSAGENLRPELVTPVSKAGMIAQARHVVEAARNEPSFDRLNDLAAVLIRFGRLPEAVSLLQFLERKYPAHFETASNLGTAYELMGRNEDALTWIREGVKRNPRDHSGTEWLHIHILNAKLGRIPTPAAGRSILNLDFGNDAIPRRPAALPVGAAGQPRSLYAVGKAVRYQLLERIQFIAAPDPMVAGLLLDWANLELLAGTVESADVLYDAALRYGSKEGRIIAVRKAQVAKVLGQWKVKMGLLHGSCELCQPPNDHSEDD
jgi:tetratricopeptide (TPR) repeat protein